MEVQAVQAVQAVEAAAQAARALLEPAGRRWTTV